MSISPTTHRPSKGDLFLRRIGVVWAFCTTRLGTLVLKTVEHLTVLAVVAVIWVGGFFIVTKAPGNSMRDRMIALVQLINDNWKAFVLLGIPMFYRTVRTFFEEVQEWAGMKRKQPPAERLPEERNPPGSQ